MGKSIKCLYTLHNALDRSILEYWSVVWQPYLAKDKLLTERVQNNILKFIAVKMKIHYKLHDHYNIRQALNIPSSAFRRDLANLHFIFLILNDTLVTPRRYTLQRTLSLFKK